MNYVSAPQAGAIATFSGTTRDTFEGKTVVELKYEAYVPMAIRNLNPSVPQLGTVPVGETSVFVAVSATHRADALDACKFLIDELKASVPIWKKEVYSNGEVWKENAEFLERRLELGKDGSCCRRKIETHDKRGCCKPKVKLDEAADISTAFTFIFSHAFLDCNRHVKNLHNLGKNKLHISQIVWARDIGGM